MTRRLLVPALIALAAWCATAPGLDGSFVYDDALYVVENPAVSGDAPVWSSPLGNPRQGLWRPLTVLSFRMQWENEFSPRALHAGNIVLHVLASLLVLLLARRLQFGSTAAAIAGLLFAVHPVHAESVAWVTGRAELLATVFVLISWCAWTSSGRGAVAVSLLALACAGLSKENAFAAPALFVLTDLALKRRPMPWGRVALMGATVIGVFSLRLVALPQLLPADGPFTDTGFGGRLVVALNILGSALRLLVWPHPLRVEYQRHEFQLADPANLLAVAALAVVVVLIWKRHRPLALALVLIPVALLPVLNLVPIGEAFAERFLYLPSVVFCLAAGATFGLRARSEVDSGHGLGLSVAVMVVLVVISVPMSRAATRVFRTDLSLWRHAAQVAPHLPLARYNLGLFLDRAGQHLTHDRGQTGCMDELRASLELDPSHVYAGYAHEMLGTHALGQRGVAVPASPWTAADHYRKAIVLAPGLFDARIHLATIAAAAPETVGVAEALAALAPITLDGGALDEQVLAARELERQLAESVSTSSDSKLTGTSSPEGS